MGTQSAPVPEAAKARLWRSALKLSRAELSRLTGYSAQAIYMFERHDNHAPEVLKRYKLACLGVAVLRRLSLKSVDDWTWET